MQTILEIIAFVVGFFFFVWLVGDLAERIPPKLKVLQRPVDARKLRAWLNIRKVEGLSYHLHHSSEWQLGPEFTLVCEGTVSFGDNEYKGDVRLSVHSFKDAYLIQNTFGRASFFRLTEGVQEASPTIHLSIGRADALAILQESRQGHLTECFLYGWEDEKRGILIDHAEFT